MEGVLSLTFTTTPPLTWPFVMKPDLGINLGEVYFGILEDLIHSNTSGYKSGEKGSDMEGENGAQRDPDVLGGPW